MLKYHFGSLNFGNFLFWFLYFQISKFSSCIFFYNLCLKARKLRNGLIFFKSCFGYEIFEINVFGFLCVEWLLEKKIIYLLIWTFNFNLLIENNIFTNMSFKF